ncbi:phage tail protein [Acetobacteraceae bacterium ESL0709]|nr:phage tail protein [Acetobacteraceae bacterium ESL0697]MDF7677749.1 phage tail protein [Acetobacteraceae bacterium ESL0709]
MGIVINIKNEQKCCKSSQSAGTEFSSSGCTDGKKANVSCQTSDTECEDISINIGNQTSCCTGSNATKEVNTFIPQKAVENSAETPVGAIQYWPSREAPSMAGWALLNGFSFDPALYPELAKIYPDHKVSDPSGLFLRVLDPQNIHDSEGANREIGSIQLGSLELASSDDNLVAFHDVGHRPASLCWDFGTDLNGVSVPNSWVNSSGSGTVTFAPDAIHCLGRSRPSNMAMNLIIYTGVAV